jgi:hypothetical protein
MSQHDMSAADSDGATVRADFNSALAALVSLSSGATEPTTTFAYMWWADTTTGILKRRNAADSAWVSVMTLATGLIIGTDVQAYDADTLKADTDDTLTGGFGGTDDADGTKSSGTYTPTYAGGNFKTATNGGAHTLAPQSGTGTIIILYTNNGSAGAITTSGYDVVTGDSFDTTNTNAFMCYSSVIGAEQHLHIVAMQ